MCSGTRRTSSEFLLHRHVQLFKSGLCHISGRLVSICVVSVQDYHSYLTVGCVEADAREHDDARGADDNDDRLPSDAIPIDNAGAARAAGPRGAPVGI
jgi:hypothetical protein